MIIVSDAGPLIALARTGNLDILQRLFVKVIIPPAVFDELKISDPRRGALELKQAIKDHKWLDVSDPIIVPEPISNSLDAGEAEAIFLAKREGSVLLIDERRGRRIAKKEEVKVTGTGAVLAAAKQRGIIEQVSPYIDELMSSGYRISSPLRKKILKLAGEKE